MQGGYRPQEIGELSSVGKFVNPPQMSKTAVQLYSASEPGSLPVGYQTSGEVFWTGFLTRNQQNSVGVNGCLLYSTRDLALKESSINIAHRTIYDEAVNKNYCALVLLTPSSELYQTGFEEYIKYFQEKQRAGYAVSSQFQIYILPPCKQAEMLCKFSPMKQQLLAILVEIDYNNAYFGAGQSGG